MEANIQEYIHDLFYLHCSPLSSYLENDTVQDIMINHDGRVWIEDSGELYCTDLLFSPQQKRAIIQLIGSITPTPSQYVIEADIHHLRLVSTKPPVSPQGDIICIRKHYPHNKRISSFQKKDTAQSSLSLEKVFSHQPNVSLDRLLKNILNDKKSILISGSTGSGKTTLLRSMLCSCRRERIILLEDILEIQPKHPHCISLAYRACGFSTALALSLRCRPDRIVIGEIRHAQESWAILDTCHTGHAALCMTVHADSAENTLSRFEGLLFAGRPQSSHQEIQSHILNTFGYIIFCKKEGNWRGPVKIIQLNNIDEQGQYQYHVLFEQ